MFTAMKIEMPEPMPYWGKEEEGGIVIRYLTGIRLQLCWSVAVSCNDSVKHNIMEDALIRERNC